MEVKEPNALVVVFWYTAVDDFFGSQSFPLKFEPFIPFKLQGKTLGLNPELSIEKESRESR